MDRNLSKTYWRKTVIESYKKDLKKLNPTSVFYQISGKIFGIIGLGRCGKQVAKYANAFGMNVQFFGPYVNACFSYKKMCRIKIVVNAI